MHSDEFSMLKITQECVTRTRSVKYMFAMARLLHYWSPLKWHDLSELRHLTDVPSKHTRLVLIIGENDH